MKYLMIDDEHELYRRMFSDFYNQNEYSPIEIPRMKIPKLLRGVYNIHFSDRINRHIWLPFKSLWNGFYELHKYPFQSDEEYCVLMMNGTLKYHFSKKYLVKFKENHPNVKLVLIFYDCSSNKSANRSFKMIDIFDYIFSFDDSDCKKYGFEPIYGILSKPDFVKYDHKKYSKAFFIGYGVGRLEILKKTFSKITSKVENCKFYIAGVSKENLEDIPGVIYNQTMSYDEELQYAYNTDCVVEILKEGQTGATIRTCEAILFNKKLLTNNKNIVNMPFYDSRFMRVFTSDADIDFDFLNAELVVNYNDSMFFSPLKILEKLNVLTMKK